MPEIFAYTDGACSGNPGPGGWGAVLVARDGERVLKERELSGGEAPTTNNRMELMAAIAALEALDRPATLTLVTDSAYLRDGVTSWIHGWKRNGWLTADRKPVKNADLWQRLDAAAARHQSPGSGSRATPATPRTNAPTPSPARAWRRSSRATRPVRPSLPGDVNPNGRATGGSAPPSARRTRSPASCPAPRPPPPAPSRRPSSSRACRARC